MFFIVTILFFLLVVSFFCSKFYFGRILLFITVLSFLYIVFLPITYTLDRQIYELSIALPEYSDRMEPTFNLIVTYIRNHNYDYQFLHFVFISIYSFIYTFLINKFSKNVFIVTILYIPLVFIFYGTQLRYFLGYYSVLLGFYYLYVDKNKKLSVVCFTFGILSHYSLILFIPFYFLLKIKNNFFSRIVKYTLSIFVGYLILTTVVVKILSGFRFVSYLEGDLVSSYSGGLFTFLPFIGIYYFSNIYYKKRISLNPALKNDLIFSYLYKMSIIPLIYIGVAFSAQVIGHRFIMTGLLFPILLFLYKFNEVKFNKFSYLLVFSILYILIFIHLNFSTGLVLGDWDGVNQIEKMILSNELLKYLII